MRTRAFPAEVARRKVGRRLLLSAGLGTIWGLATYWLLAAWRTIPIVSDNGWGTALVWSIGLVVLLALPTPGSGPAATGATAATFWVTAVLGYYATYVALLALGFGAQDTRLDLGDPGAWRSLWFLLKSSVAQWLAAGLVGGFVLGWVWGQVTGRVRARA